MQRIECRASRLPFLLLICLVGRPAGGAPRQDDAPPRVMAFAADGERIAPLAAAARRPVNGLRYTITQAKPPIIRRANDVTVMPTTTQSPSSDDSGLTQMVSAHADGLLQTLQRSGIVDTLMRFLAPSQKQEPAQQLDAPVGRSPRRDSMSDSPTFSSSIDSRPVDARQSSKSIGSVPDWKHTLFGPQGMFTEIFNSINEKRKEDERQRANVAAATAAAVASAAKTQADANAQPDFDFGKIVEAFLTKTQSGTFDEPPPEIPFLGICDRLSCGDIYKAFDEFRKSELFSNFQTAISLLHDQKGWDIIGELLANPDLIDTFTGGGGAGDGAAKGAPIAKISSMLAKGAVVDGGGTTSESTDGVDIGIDFSEMVDERPVAGSKSLKREQPDRQTFGGASEMPEIAESVDYYNSVDKAEVEETVPKSVPTKPAGIETEQPHGSLIPGQPPAGILSGMAPSPTAKFASGGTMPEIAESVDEYPDGMTDHVDVEETIPLDGKPPAVQVPKSPAITMPKSTESPVLKSTAGGVAKIFGGNGSRIIGAPAPAGAIVRVPLVPTRAVLSTTTKALPSPRTTRRNFRRFNDYYSMYYDNNS